MRFLLQVSVLGLATVGVLSAGYVSIGTSGLTSSVVSNGCSVADQGPGAAAVASGCSSGVTPSGLYTELSYSNILFKGAQSLQNALPASGATLTDTNGVKFTLDSDSNKTFWGASGDTSATGYITVPVGQYGVDQIYTLLNTYFPNNGTAQASEIVYFNFSPTSATDTGSDVIQVGVTLTNGTASNPGQVASATCVSGTGSVTTAVPCAQTNLAPSSSAAMTLNGVADGTTTVTTSVAYSSNYLSNNAGSTNYYNNTYGTLYLDDQGFNFGTTYANDYLVSISIYDENGPTSSSLSNDYNRTALSAITVVTNSSATPEPGTILLLLSGIGAVVFFSIRARKQSA